MYKCQLAVAVAVLIFVLKDAATVAFPFYVFSPGASGEVGTQTGKIVKIWNGLGAELLGIHQFIIEFPVAADEAARTTLVGGVFLLNQVFFEQQQNGNGVVLN